MSVRDRRPVPILTGAESVPTLGEERRPSRPAIPRLPSDFLSPTIVLGSKKVNRNLVKEALAAPVKSAKLTLKHLVRFTIITTLVFGLLAMAWHALNAKYAGGALGPRRAHGASRPRLGRSPHARVCPGGSLWIQLLDLHRAFFLILPPAIGTAIVLIAGVYTWFWVNTLPDAILVKVMQACRDAPSRPTSCTPPVPATPPPRDSEPRRHRATAADASAVDPLARLQEVLGIDADDLVSLRDAARQINRAVDSLEQAKASAAGGKGRPPCARSAPSASLDHLKAWGSPPPPRAPPQQLGGFLRTPGLVREAARADLVGAGGLPPRRALGQPQTVRPAPSFRPASPPAPPPLDAHRTRLCAALAASSQARARHVSS